MIVPTLQYEMVNVIAVMIVCVHKMALDPVLRRVLQFLPSNARSTNGTFYYVRLIGILCGVKCNSAVK
jgi:hypothetical protein